ncbi:MULTISPECIES: 23S rRNA accumulation protein YceD [Pseudoalteromonas]|uniref:23S rRNA accumulation protein YceD n=1 Tax=Pseudoalteromonas TaxID=53246 RepID=UPI000FFE56C3|nr:MULTISPECIES: 23S rRNA accumulation protein YceD [Pseudoalteromonas]MCG9758608.1 23S rRNA accumulation protein YceD [Pseudoalteromonas sp. Isolate6]NKC18905.1 23S rRNA accumulation protein YceD [Pseudoalteromonas galatheae]RXE87469.1 23S rRNA accumulation protein YceD [Pseudoalteromonas sp. A757]
MQKVKIPITIDPCRAAQRRASYDGVVMLEELSRLQQVVRDQNSEIAVDIHFNIDEQGLVVVQGKVRAHLTVVCQRCNDELGLDLEQDFAYSPVGLGAESDDLPERYDVLELDDEGEVNLRQIVEDELLLAIPIVPTHDEALCSYSDKPKSFGEIEAEDSKPNPFEILKQLKKDS